MNAPRRLQRPRRWKLRQLRILRRRFHEQAFGEELARVNLDFTPRERRAYLAWMRAHVARHGIQTSPSPSVGWLLDVERELAQELAPLHPLAGSAIPQTSP